MAMTIANITVEMVDVMNIHGDNGIVITQEGKYLTPAKCLRAFKTYFCRRRLTNIYREKSRTPPRKHHYNGGGGYMYEREPQ